MEKFKIGFTKFYTNILTALMGIVLFSCGLITIGSVFFYESFNIEVIIPILILAITIGLELFIIKKNISIKLKILLILFLGFILRGLWLLNINTVPISDFRVIYETAQDLLSGDTGAFWGSGYLGRFPHLTIMTLYMAFMIKVFPANNLIAMKSFNLFFGVLTIYLIYLLAKEIFNSKKLGLYGASLASFFPPLVTYVGIFCTENIAIPLYLLSTYLFILVVKKKKSKYYLVLSGIILSVGNLFRMVATIMIIAFAMYLIIYTKDKLFEKVRKVGLYLIPYLLVLFTVSTTLQGLGVTEFPLWNGSEPKVTSILKGTNIERLGRWNEEDASIVNKYNYDYDKINEASKEIIIERLTTTNPIKLAGFYIIKFAMQWSIGDFEGAYLSKLDIPEEAVRINVSLWLIELIYACIMILVFLGLIKRRKNTEDSEINLIYLMLCGYGVMYLVTEAQGRYSLIIAWAFIIFAIEGIRVLLNKYNISEEFENTTIY
ncbi:phospholipid carrier-dependent glycosyltransferase [Clostridium sartagoforme]|uniref:Phospholipid carrier-dependent glycosyltransferase n=1 Tax=Clostridium sartagoforme TaxID=84031 RepID=A0A4S2DIV0_9CLOT|nr:glycosyltransferase family 39 protein [Clostridium sartagoforme]TGY42099.1 phospholipid carrier-dependent glycosyltransferase [Clostridium sartagoforme]